MRPWVRRILFIGIGVAVATRFTGINTIMFYGTQILTEAGFGRQIAIIANVANGLTSVIATFFGIWMLGKIGRVTMFKTGIIGTMLSLLTIALAAMNFEGSPSLPYIVLSMTILFLFFMQGMIVPCLWLLLAEIFPLSLRALGGGICVFCLWLVDACIGVRIKRGVLRLRLRADNCLHFCLNLHSRNSRQISRRDRTLFPQFG